MAVQTLRHKLTNFAILGTNFAKNKCPNVKYNFWALCFVLGHSCFTFLDSFWASAVIWEHLGHYGAFSNFFGQVFGHPLLYGSIRGILGHSVTTFGQVFGHPLLYGSIWGIMGHSATFGQVFGL